MAHSIALESSLREISEGLRSPRVTDRKKNGEKLKDFLTMNAVPSMLTENTLKRKGYTWNDLFEDVNDYILKETEKYETSKTYENVTAPLCTSLLHLCVSGSNKGKAYIKAEKITEACLFILKDSRLKRAIGDAYLNLLYKHVLPQKHYLGFITPTNWEDLLDVCLAACTSSFSRLDDFAKLRIVLLVMKNAKNYCQFVIPLRDALPKWKRCFLKVAYNKKAQDVVVEITVLLLETLSVECRLTLCHFMESTLTPILKMYDQNMDQKKKLLLFQLLYYSVTLHHPLGRHRIQEGSFAEDWNTWNKQLHSILELICLEVTLMQKTRKPTEELLKQYTSFYQLAAAVYYQIFAISESAENEGESTTKRQKICFNKNKTFNDLVDELRQNHIPWLGITHMFVKCNGASISIDDYLSLIKVIEGLITSNNILNWDILEELTCSVLKNIANATSREIECKTIVVSLWNSCVRNSTAANAGKAIHSIIQHILKLDLLNYQDSNSLFKFYIERGMPVAQNSVKTLSALFYKFFAKYSSNDIRSKCILWLEQGDITSIDVQCVQELLQRLISNENINFSNEEPSKSNLYDTLFNSNDKCILFSEFELEISNEQKAQKSGKDMFELNTETEKQVSDYFKERVKEYVNKFASKSVPLLEYMKLIRVVLGYLDMGLKCNLWMEEDMDSFDLYRMIQKSLVQIYTSVENYLNSNEQNISCKINLLLLLKDILLYDMGPFMSATVRSCIHQEFFLSINKILTVESKADDEDIVYEGEEKELNVTTIQHECVMVIAAYCRKDAEHREYLLKHILDPKIYDFSIDAPCLFQCIELLNDAGVHEPPLDLLFTLMQYMVKDLYRDPQASSLILKNLMNMLESVWSSEGQMKQNCHILMRSYVTRCEKLHYPPYVAALIYECVAKTAMLNRKYDFDVQETFENALTNKIKGDVHSLRIYCCYLLKLYIKDCREGDIEYVLSELGDIFQINVSEGQQLFLKDESMNRTLTVLHCYLALVQSKKSLSHQLVTGLLKLQKDKSMDIPFVRKVLEKILNTVGITNIEDYVENNIVSILYFWFTKKYSIDDLPVHLLGCDSLDEFKEKYKKWLISADILWCKDGDVYSCDYLKKTSGIKPEEAVAHVIESCFSEIIILCLPYMVTEKNALGYRGIEQPADFKKSMASAQKLFRMTGQILENMKWTDLFVENVGDLVLITASQLWDSRETMQMFDVKISLETKSYGYTKDVFSAILEYIGDLTGGNIMQYLCENQPISVFRVLFSLWQIVLNEKIFEFKLMELHAFIAFFENIPFGLPPDAFVSNFACKSFAHCIKDCQSSEEVRALTKGAKIVLEKLLPQRIELIRLSLSELLAILMVKKDSFEQECEDLFNYLTVDMKSYLKASEDVTDYINTFSQSNRDVDCSCSTIATFTEKLKLHKMSLTNPSPETLSNLRNLLKANKHYIKMLYHKMSTKGFSEDCGLSVIHQLVCALSNILKSVYHENKIIIEACNCLSEIGTYDLKTLVTVPPANTQKIVDIKPKHYMACVVVKSLTEVIFDKDPAVTSKVADTLNNLLKYREGCDALDLEKVDRDILRPLTSSNSNISVDVKINNAKFDQYCADNFDGVFMKALTSNWKSNDSKNHGKWLRIATTVLLRLIDSSSNYFNDLREVCEIKSSVCGKILPALVGLFLHCSTEKHVETISKHINNFFNHIWEQTFDDCIESIGDSSQINPRITCVLDIGHKMVIQYMLHVVNFVRLQRLNYKTRPDRTVECLNYLRLEYDKVAWAATVADQNLAAIYYGELWAAAQNNGVPPASPEATTNLPGGKNIQQIFRKCYVSIGEMDAMDGCGTAHLTIESEKRKHLINTGQYTDSLLLHDIALSCAGAADHDLHCGAVRSLHKSGMHHLALQYIKSLPENDELIDVKYECLSFLGDWSEIVDTKDLEEKSKLENCNPHSMIKAFHYACLKDCLNVQISEDKLLLPLDRAKLAVSRLCQSLNMENCQSVYKVVAKLHLFSDIEDYFYARMSKHGPSTMSEILTKWEVDNLPTFKDFKHMELLISQRVLILEHAAKTYERMQDKILSLQIQYAKLGLSNNRVQMSQRILAMAKKLQPSEEVALVESEISWAKGHKEIALSLLRNIVTNDCKDVNLTARSLRQYALWMAESKRDNARDIINKYLLKSLEAVHKTNHVDTKLKVYHDIAKFADSEYKQVVAYMNSSIFENKVKCMESMRGTACSLRSTQNLTSHDRKALFTNERFKDLDEVEIANTRVEKESFLHLAMRYYLLSLKECEENNLSVFRVVSLWVNNPGFEFEESDAFEQLIHGIPSRKFITVLPQLAPRLTTEDNAFAKNLRKIIKRCAIEHPHHTLPILFALKNSDKDKVITNAGRLGATPKTGKSSHQEPRTVAAEALVKELSSVSREMTQIVAQMELICDATISFANFKPKAKDSKQKIPAAEQITKLRNLDAIPIPTVTIPISNDCKYTDFPRLNGFDNYFELVGGINCPKKVFCTDSTGHKRILLIKGEDDMRQDAVMQQVFNIVNTLLEKDPITSRNKLLIRTYKVVPMSKQSGVLEWCVGTLPIGAYLVGSATSPGAHSRYRPQDITCHVARKKMQDYHEARRSNKEKLQMFLKLLSQFKPVFHYFFTEHYLDPVTWYERRLAYTKSVATSSMVGYIIGLGDRHVQNILVDKSSAEVIHIDFGIAFDQGKTLHTPETVPFRLTQDMIAGFGSSGVEGIFRGCCEKTMQLLRDNSETLLTILEVLLCDPLCSWTVSTAQQNVNRDVTVQGTSGCNSGLAERALLAVGSKLSGTEGGAAGGVAVRGQVARLLAAAADPANLCRLFPGWQPHL